MISKIIEIESKLQNLALVNNEKILKQISKNFPEFCIKVRDIDFVRLIREIMQKAIKKVAMENKYEYANTISNIRGETLTLYKDSRFACVLKTAQLPCGLGVVVNADGISFITESKRVKQAEINKLIELIEDAYSHILAKSETQKLLGSKDVQIKSAGNEQVIVVNGISD